MESILIDLAVGGTLFVIANFVATKFSKGREINKAKYYAILIISIGILITLNDNFIMPKFREWKTNTAIEGSIATLEPYMTLKTTYPADYEKLKSAVTAMAKGKETTASARALLQKIIMEKLPNSSNECIEAFFKQTMDVVDYLNKNGNSEMAFNLLFNTKELPVGWAKILPAEFATAETNSYKLVLLSASQNKSYPVDKAKVDKIMEKVSEELYKKFGDDVALLQNPLAQTGKRDKILTMSIDMYQRIFNLPESERYMVLRSFI